MRRAAVLLSRRLPLTKVSLRSNYPTPHEFSPLPKPFSPFQANITPRIESLAELNTRFHIEALEKVIPQFAEYYNTHTHPISEEITFEEQHNWMRIGLRKKYFDLQTGESEVGEFCYLIADGAGGLIEVGVNDNDRHKENLFETVYHQFCDKIALLPAASEVVGKALNPRNSDFTYEDLAKRWSANKILAMRLLHGAPRTFSSIVCDLPLTYNNSLYQDLRYVDPKKITAENLQELKKSCERDGLKLDVSGGEESVRSFLKFVKSKILEGRVLGYQANLITPQTSPRTAIPFAGRPVTLVTRDIKQNLIHIPMPKSVDEELGAVPKFITKEKPEAVGIIINPDHPSCFFPYGATRDMHSNEGMGSNNYRIFNVEVAAGELDKDKFEDNFAKSPEEIIHRTRVRNLLTHNPKSTYATSIHPDFGRERNTTWNEAWGNYAPESICGIVMLDLSQVSSKSALQLLNYYPQRPIVRYSYLLNELILVNLEDLRALANTKERLPFIFDKMEKIFFALDPNAKKIDFLGDKDAFIIKLRSSSPLLEVIGRAGNLFFEATEFYKKAGDDHSFMVRISEFAAFEDFAAQIKKSTPYPLILSNQLFTLIQCSSQYESVDETPASYEPGSVHRDLNLEIKKDNYAKTRELGARAYMMDGEVHPENICFVFPHPKDPEIECVAFVANNTNRCAFFDKSGGEYRYVGDAFPLFMSERQKEFSTGFVYDIASYYSDIKTAQIRSKIVKAGVEVSLEGEEIVIKINRFLGRENNVANCFKEFVGDGFADSNSMAYHDVDEDKIKLRGAKISAKGEIEINFDEQKHRDNFIRLFAADKSFFMIDDSPTKIIIRRELVDELKKTDPHHGREKTLKTFVDLSNVNREREIDFESMRAPQVMPIKAQRLMDLGKEAGESRA